MTLRGVFGGALDVGHHHGRIGRRLNEHDAGILGANGWLRPARRRIRRHYGNAGHAERLQELVDQAVVPP